MLLSLWNDNFFEDRAINGEKASILSISTVYATTEQPICWFSVLNETHGIFLSKAFGEHGRVSSSPIIFGGKTIVATK